MKTIPPKININGEEKDNSFHVVLDLDENFHPFLKDFHSGFRFDISMLFLKEIILNKQKRMFNKWLSLVYENGFIVDLVEENSDEAKKIIKNSLLKIRDIPQGTMVRVYAGKEFIYLKKLYLTRTSVFLNYIKPFGSSLSSFDKKIALSKFNKFHLFLHPEHNKLVLVDDKALDFRVTETYNIVPEFSELNYNFENKLFLELNVLCLFDCIEKAIRTEHPFNRNHQLFRTLIMIKNSSELNYLEQKIKIEREELNRKKEYKYIREREENEDLPF